MITPGDAFENPELMIKHKDDIKDEAIFDIPWCWVFWKHPYLYGEFSDRFDETARVDIYLALRENPRLVLDFKYYLHKINRWDIAGLMEKHPELSLCLKHKDNPDKIGAAYYILFPDKLNNLNKEEKREMSKRIMELLREEKI